MRFLAWLAHGLEKSCTALEGFHLYTSFSAKKTRGGELHTVSRYEPYRERSITNNYLRPLGPKNKVVQEDTFMGYSNFLLHEAKGEITFQPSPWGGIALVGSYLITVQEEGVSV